MSYHVEWSRQAIKSLKKLNKSDQARVFEGVGQFAATEYGDVKKLKAVKDSEYRLRIGSWRVRFTISDDSSAIIVHDVFSRNDGYR